MPFPDLSLEVIQSAIEFVPTLNHFGFDQKPQSDQRKSYNFIGGELNGLKRLDEFIFERKSLQTYAETRNELTGEDFSSKLSPWLANGCISIRDVYRKTKAFEHKYGDSDSTKHFVDELFWREFCRFWALRYETKIFFEYGVYKRTQYNWETNEEVI